MSYYRQFSAVIENYKIKTSFVSSEEMKAKANKTVFDLIFVEICL